MSQTGLMLYYNIMLMAPLNLSMHMSCFASAAGNQATPEGLNAPHSRQLPLAHPYTPTRSYLQTHMVIGTGWGQGGPGGHARDGM